MSYAIHPDESVRDSVIRVARDQIGKAIEEIEDPNLDRHDTVHQVRKRCKKLRGLIRLVRPALGDRYAEENACFRNAARSLSGLRDAQSRIECLNALTDHFADEVQEDFAQTARRRLHEHRYRMARERSALEENLGRFLDVMQHAYQRAGSWRLEDDGFAAVAGGLRKTYTRGRKSMKRAYADPRAETFHQWRKSAKYHGYHLRLLRPMWPPVLRTFGSELGELADLLGAEHDLAVLADTLLKAPREFGSEVEVQALLGLVERRSLELRQRAGTLGARLFAEPPDALVDRMSCYWTAGKQERQLEPGISPELAASA